MCAINLSRKGLEFHCGEDCSVNYFIKELGKKYSLDFRPNKKGAHPITEVKE